MNEQQARALSERLRASPALTSRGLTFEAQEPRFGAHNPRQVFGVAALKKRRRIDFMSTPEDVIVFLVDQLNT